MAGVNVERSARFRKALATELGLDVTQTDQISVTWSGGDPMVKVEWTGFKYLYLDEYADLIDAAQRAAE